MACSSARNSSGDINNVRIQVISGSFGDTYDATLETITRQGFNITSSDAESGIIEAVYQYPRDIELRGNFFIGYDPRAAIAMHVETLLTEIDASSTRLEINLFDEVRSRESSAYQVRDDQTRLRPVRTTHQYEVLFQDIRSRLN